MAGFDLERAIVGPQVHRSCYARNASFENLMNSQQSDLAHTIVQPYHLRRFSTSNGEFEVGIFLPIAKQKRELRKKAVVRVSGGCDGLWAGISIQAALEGLSGAYELLPILKVIRILELSTGKVSVGASGWGARME
jgi:hypothetical protein